MRNWNFGAVFKAVRFRLANNIGTDEDAVKALMDGCGYKEEIARQALNGMKKGIEKDRLKREGKDMRTKSNRAKKPILTVEQIRKNYEERGRLLKGEIEYLLERAKDEPVSPLDTFVYPKEDVFENFDNEQIVTLGVGIGTWMLMLIDRNLPQHALLARKNLVGDVQSAIMALAHGLGKPLSSKALDYWCAVWNLTWNMAMKKIRDDYEVADKAEYYIEGEHGENKADN